MLNLTALMYVRTRALYGPDGVSRPRPMRRAEAGWASELRRRTASLLISSGLALWPAARQLASVAPLFSALNLVITQ